MSKLILISSLFFFSHFGFGQSQDVWKVYRNKRLVFQATNPDETKNKLVFQQADLKKEGYVLIYYREGQPKKNWNRSFSINDEKDSSLMQKDGVMIRLLHTEIKKLMKNHTKLKIFTWSVPTDPKEAALVRVRRIPVCTIELR